MEKYYQAFVDEFGRKPTNFVEIGSRDGNHAEVFRKLGDINPQRVVAIDPHPTSFKSILTNYPDFRAYQLAISDKPGIVKFNAIPNTYNVHVMGTSSLLTIAEDKKHLYPPANWIKVLAITGESLLELIDWWEIDACKIDVEGFTYEVLESFGRNIRTFKSLHLEVEKDGFQIWANQHSYSEISKHLTYWGFKEMYYLPMFWNGNQGDSVWMRIGERS